MNIKRLSIAFMVALLLAAAFAGGCNDATGPAAADDARSRIDPADGAAVLKTLTADLPAGGHARVTLLGSDLALDEDGIHVSLTVALRNDGELALPGPVVLWLDRFDPSGVFVADPDTSLPTAGILPVDGFLYGNEFGADGVLAPGETSAGRLWTFRTPAQEPFSFAIRLAAVIRPPAIAGICFWDNDRDGVPDAGEPPLYPGHVMVQTPGGVTAEIHVNAEGRYVYPLPTAGLYRLTYVQDFETFAALEYTTPNPREVLITADGDGHPLGFDRAHFGAHTALPAGPPRILFTDLPPDSLHRVMWSYEGAGIRDGSFLVLDAGFPGCDPDHVFSLWMSGGIRESEPPQVDLVPVHETDEACDAAWRRDMVFDLGPLARRYLEAYGPGDLILNVVDFAGVGHPLTWRIER